MALATFGAGCFWGVEYQFRKLAGVLDAACGYMGGLAEHPTYEQVCTDRTGHAEVVQVEYDPEQIGYDALLAHFWQIHDPTQVNRQGPDYGAQYRSVVFVHDAAQRRAAEESKAAENASGRHRSPIATQICDAGPFWRAEEYHQQYYVKQGIAPVCATPRR